MLAQYENTLLTHFSDRYRKLFNKDERIESTWQSLLTLQYPKLHLNAAFGGYGLGDAHNDLLIYELGRSKKAQPTIVNKLFFVDILNFSTFDVTCELCLDEIINDDNVIFFVSPKNVSMDKESSSIIINGHLATLMTKKNSLPLIAGIYIDHKIYYFDLSAIEPKKNLLIQETKVMNRNTLSITANRLILALDQTILRVSIPTLSESFFAQRLFRFFFCYFLGICSKMFDLTKARIVSRKQFAKQISEFQGVRFGMARIYAELHVLMVQLTSIENNQGLPKEQLLLAKEHLSHCMQTSMQYFGAYSLLCESDISEFYCAGAYLLIAVTKLLEDYDE